MPKFSAYMRGEEGPQGDVGQAVLLNGIVSSSSELPPNTQNQKNLVYYVGDEQEGYNLYVYTTTEGQWQNLGSIKGQKGDTGPAAGFAINQSYEIFAVDPDAEPQISIIPDPNSPDTAKIFNFTFGLPRGQNAGFNQNQNIEIENVDSVQQMYASVSTDENSPNTAKIFNFKFGIPRGEAADFGEPTASISTISSLSTASVSITSSGSATSKIFDFHFDIPQGQKGDRGDSFSIYEPVAFTTGSEYWVDNTTFVYPRGDNSKLPIYIYNEDTDKLDNSSFTFTNTDIIYNSEQPFNGTLYLMAGANRPTINIGEVSTTSFDGQMSASLNERSTSSDAIIDFILARGPHGESGGFGEVTSSAELIPSASTYIKKDSIVSFSTDYDINDVTVDIEPIQEGSGDPSPDNVHPISGWTGCNITRTGKNLCPLPPEETKNGITLVHNTDGSFTITGSATATTYFDFFSGNFNSNLFVGYKFKFISTFANVGINSISYRISKSDRVKIQPDNNTDTEIIVQDYGSELYVGIRIANNYTLPSNGITVYPMLILSTESEIFEPYQGTTYPISWSTQAGTVYGGSLDVTTGVLTVNWRSITLTGAETEDWKISNTGTADWYYITKNNILTALAKNNSDNIKTNLYPWASVLDASTANGFWGSTNNGAFRVRWGTEDAIVNWRNFLASNPLHIVYKTSEPLTYQLTPTQITALLGQNNIWADTGDVQVSYNKFNQPYVEITTDEDSPNTAKRFNFHFGIPEGKKGEPGDAFAIYEPLSFTTGSSYWMGNTLVVPRGDNNKLPLFIYNRDNNNIAATFKLENNYIRHDADSPFNGTLYMMSQTNRSTLRIGNVSTTTYGNGSHFSLNEASTSTDAIFDVVLEQGPRGETALSAQVGRVSYTSGIPNVEIEGEQNLVFNFDLPRGFKGEKGDTFTVDVDETIDVLGYNETPVVETTSTSTGIALKFKLPPSVSAQLGDLSQYNSISLTTNLITGILPVSKGGTGVNQLTTNAIILGNNTAIKQKATSAGAFYASGNNVEPGFDTLPIAYGGTGTTTAAEAWTALGGGSIGKLNSLTANNIPSLDAGKITTGTFSADRIPNLNASKITAGTLNINIIPDLSASKITSGTLGVDRIPALDTSKIASGTLPFARGGTNGTSRLGALQQLTNENVGSSAQYFLTITTNWAKGGYTSVADAKTVLGLGSLAYKSSLSLATGDNNGQVKIEGTNIAVKGLGSAAYTNSTAYAAASHTHSYLPLSGGTMTGALNLANNTWNNIGDDCALGDCNVGGCIGIKGLNNTTGLNFIQYGGTAAGTIKWSGSNFTFSHAIIIPSSMYGISKPSTLANGQLYFVYEN